MSRLSEAQARDAMHKSSLKRLKKLVDEGAVVVMEELDREPLVLLDYAAEKGDLEGVRRLLSAGADPNHLDEGRAALHVAARRAQSAVIGELVRAGADPNLAQEDTLYTPLHAATLRGHCDAIAELVRWGADLNRGDYNGQTPLHLACGAGLTDTVRLLVALGAEVELRDRLGRTPLHWAALHASITRVLINAGADRYAVALSGATAVSLAEQLGSPAHAALVEREKIP